MGISAMHADHSISLYSSVLSVSLWSIPRGDHREAPPARPPLAPPAPQPQRRRDHQRREKGPMRNINHSAPVFQLWVLGWSHLTVVRRESEPKSSQKPGRDPSLGVDRVKIP